ncbi:MAG: AI-2E family transporter, partial [Candidatus Xenobia bacterium]
MGIERLGLHPTAARATWTVAVVLVLLDALYQIRETLFILTLAVFFSYMVYPLVDLVQRHVRGRTSRTGAIAIVYVAVMACLIMGAVAMGSRIVTEASSLAIQLPGALQDPQWLQRLPLPHVFDSYRPQLLDALRSQVASISENMVPLLKQFGAELLGYAGNVVYVVLIPVLSFLLSRDAPDLRRSLLDWIQDRDWWQGILNDLNVLLAGYMRALLLLALATTVIFSIFLSLVVVPYSVLLAVL